MATVYRVGTSGFSYGHWRGTFYPERLPQRRWLEHYAEHFDTVELNNPFYRLPSEKSMVGWRDRVPEGFRYAVKASRFITHVKQLREVEDATETFLARAGVLGERLGPVLYQLPPGMGRDPELLEGFLAALPPGVKHVVEFRNRSWYDEEVLELLRRHGVGFCVHDMKDLESPLVATADFAYLRFHGPTGTYAGNYPEETLRCWAERIAGMGDLRETYVYFNNDIGGHAVHNARTLRELLG